MDEQMQQAQEQQQQELQQQPQISEPVQQEPEIQEPIQQEPTQIDNPQPPENVDMWLEDGELKFSDKFFDDVKDGTQTPPTPQPQQQAPKYYTDEELQNTPFEQWDFNRMPEEAKRYAQLFNSQIQARNEALARQQQIAQRTAQAPIPFQKVEQYTPQELSKDASQLAAERLGLANVEDLDVYENEHAAALQIAMNELSQKRNYEIANYNRNVNGYQTLQQFNAEIAARPDFNEYNQWFQRTAQAEGTTPRELNDRLFERVMATGDWAGAQQTISTWYQMFLQSKAAQQPRQQPAGQQQQRRVQAPPTLESTRGGDSNGRGRVDYRKFGDMDSDAQAQALMDMGIV